MEWMLRVEGSLEAVRQEVAGWSGCSAGGSGGSMEEGLERRLRGACPASGKGRKNAAAEVSRVFRATGFPLCVVTVYPSGPDKVGTVITWALPTSLGLPLAAWPASRSPVLSNQLAVHYIFHKEKQSPKSTTGCSASSTAWEVTSLTQEKSEHLPPCLPFRGCTGLMHAVCSTPEGTPTAPTSALFDGPVVLTHTHVPHLQAGTAHSITQVLGSGSQFGSQLCNLIGKLTFPTLSSHL